MLTDYESLCCREVDRARELCQDQGVSCITKHPWFELYCLNRPVLDLAYVTMQYFCPLDAGNRTQEEYVYSTDQWCSQEFFFGVGAKVAGMSTTWGAERGRGFKMHVYIIVSAKYLGGGGL